MTVELAPADFSGVLPLYHATDLRFPLISAVLDGSTVQVRFDHAAQPLAQRWYRELRQVFLQHLNPAG